MNTSDEFEKLLKEKSARAAAGIRRLGEMIKDASDNVKKLSSAIKVIDETNRTLSKMLPETDKPAKETSISPSAAKKPKLYLIRKNS